MQFPYIPISTLIADIRSELKRFNQSNDINDEDCYNWALECVREIGFSNYMEESTVLKICRNTASLPKDLYLISDIFICDEVPNAQELADTIWFSTNESKYTAKQRLYPGDSFTSKVFCVDKKTIDFGTGNAIPTYIVRHPNILKCSIGEATVGIKYLKFPIENGEYLIQDEINTIKATKAFMITKILMEKYILGSIPQHVYLKFENEYNVHLDLAQAIMKFPNPIDDEIKGYIQDHRYDNFKLR